MMGKMEQKDKKGILVPDAQISTPGGLHNFFTCKVNNEDKQKI